MIVEKIIRFVGRKNILVDRQFVVKIEIQRDIKPPANPCNSSLMRALLL